MSLRAHLAKDLRVEVRTRDSLTATLTVALLVALVGNVAFAGRPGMEGIPPHLAIPGALWMGIVFGAQVGLARAFVVERDGGTLEGIMTSPSGSLSVYVSKALVQTLVVLLVAVTTLFALAVFFRVGREALPLTLIPILLLGVIGVVLVTTLAAAMAMHGRNWILLVPLLSLPSLFPVLAAAVPATGILLAGAPLEAVYPHLRVLLAIDVVFATAAWLLVPFILEP